MDPAPHLIAQRGVHESMSLSPSEPLERGRDDRDGVMTASGSRPGVAGVKMAFVHDLQVSRTQGARELLSDQFQRA